MLVRARWRGISVWLGLLVSLIFVYVAVRDVDPGAFWAALRGREYWLLGPAGILLAAAIAVRVVRWRLLFPPGHRPATRVLGSALLIGYFFNSILPARAGEAARVVVLNQRAGSSRFETLGTVVAERVLDVLCLLILFFLVAPTLPGVEWLPRVLALAAALFAGLLVALLAVAHFGQRPARLLLRPLAALPGIAREQTDKAAANLVHGFSFVRRPASALAATGLTLVSWVVIALSFWLCLVAFDLRLGLEAALLVVIAVNLAMILPSGPAAVGVFEAAAIFALAAFGVDRTAALSYAIVVHGLNVLPFVALGYPLLHHHARRVRRERDRAARVDTDALGPPLRFR